MNTSQKIIIGMGFLFSLITNSGFGQLYYPDPVYPSLNIMHLHVNNQSISVEDDLLLNGSIWMYAMKYDANENTTKCLGKGVYQGGNGMTLTINGQDDFAFGYQAGDTLQLLFEMENGCLSDSLFMDEIITFESGVFKEIEAINVFSKKWTSLNVMDGLCGENTATISIDTPDNQAPFSYLWSTGETASTIENLSDGTYFVTITSPFACVTIDSVSVFNTEALLIDLESEALDTFCRSTVSVMGGTAPFSFEWSSGEIMQTAVELPVGEFSVTVTDNNGCTSSITGNCIINAIESNLPLKLFDISPNPTSGVFRVSSVSSDYLPEKIEIFTSAGQKLENILFKNVQSGLSIDLSNQLEGVYFIKLSSPTYQVFKKIILTR